jgi:hypothetical protein
MDATRLAEILAAHAQWLTMKGGRRAYLQEAYLRDANLQDAYLQDAYLRGANLRGAYLQDANLQGANLQGANLRGAYLQGANLQGANLQGAYLQGAYLQGANLQDANLQGAYLQGAYLQGAYLQGANLQDANLQGAYLQGVKLPELTAAQTLIVTQGTLIGWKKCQGGVLVRLRIPRQARRSNATGRKCRAEYVKVLEVIGSDVGVTNPPDGVRTEYRAGEIVRCHQWCEDRWQECAGGIHFFLTREEAEDYSC